MCRNCRLTSVVMLAAILRDGEHAVEDMNVQARAARGQDFTPGEREALDFTKQGVVAVAELIRLYTTPDLSGAGRQKAIEEIVLPGSPSSIPVAVLVTGAKFAHYSAMILNDIASLLDRAIDLHAHDKHDEQAITFAFGDVGESIERTRRALAAYQSPEKDDDDEHEHAVGIDVTTLLRGIMKDAARRTQPPVNPDYRH